MRLSLIYANTHWQAKTQGDAAYIVYPDGLAGKPKSFGWMMSQNVAYANAKPSATQPNPFLS